MIALSSFLGLINASFFLVLLLQVAGAGAAATYGVTQSGYLTKNFFYSSTTCGGPIAFQDIGALDLCFQIFSSTGAVIGSWAETATSSSKTIITIVKNTYTDGACQSKSPVSVVLVNKQPLNSCVQLESTVTVVYSYVTGASAPSGSISGYSILAATSQSNCAANSFGANFIYGENICIQTTGNAPTTTGVNVTGSTTYNCIGNFLTQTLYSDINCDNFATMTTTTTPATTCNAASGHQPDSSTTYQTQFCYPTLAAAAAATGQGQIPNPTISTYYLAVASLVIALAAFGLAVINTR